MSFAGRTWSRCCGLPMVTQNQVIIKLSHLWGWLNRLLSCGHTPVLTGFPNFLPCFSASNADLHSQTGFDISLSSMTLVCTEVSPALGNPPGRSAMKRPGQSLQIRNNNNLNSLHYLVLTLCQVLHSAVCLNSFL